MKNQKIYQFGRYAGVPVEWQILREDADKIFVLSKYILDAKVFFPDCIYTGWAKSSIRTWLNEIFFEKAFSPQEQKRIRKTELFTPDCTGFKNYAENHTQDALFLLSEQEIQHLLPNCNDRVALPERHAVNYSKDLYQYEKLLSYYNTPKNCWWWLRSPGTEPNMMGTVCTNGMIAHFGHYVNYERGIRPAMYINLK